MIAEMIESPAAEVHEEFAQRATELALPCWCLSITSAITLRPAVGGPSDDSIISAARSSQAKHTYVVVHDESDLLAIPDEYGAVVVQLPAESPGFNRDSIVRVLTNYHLDLTTLARDRRAIEGFNSQLSQSYEEVNLIFKMSRFLAANNDPLEAVRTMCDELRSVIGYGWVALLFEHSNSTLEPLRGTLIHSGLLPCGEDELRRHGIALSQAAVGKVLVPHTNELAARAGAEVLHKRLMHGSRQIGLLLTGNRQGIDPDISSNEIQLVDATTGFLELFHQNAFRFAEQREQFFGTLHALTSAVDAKDPYTAGHSERVGLLGAQLAAKLGQDAETVEATRVAGLLHDIGKIGIPEAILTKPARLTDEEFEIIKRHPVVGHKILAQLPTLGFHLPGVLHHHERWDGRGYPQNLQGENIPHLARILAFADTFDAMSSNRAYRSALTRTKVLDEIRRSSGTQFDPQMVETFVSLDFSEFDRLLDKSGVLARPIENK